MSRALKTAVSWTMYPTMLVAALVATWSGIAAGYDLPLVVMAVITTSALPLLVAQRLMPFERDWKAAPRDYWIDLLHGLTTTFTTDILRAAILTVVTAAAVVLHGWLGSTLWPTEWPVVAQFAMALVIGDFGAYWVHRTCHRWPLMWRVHAMHHSSEKMYVGAAVRNHPFNAILMHTMHLLPMTLLGAPLEFIALTSVFTGVNGMLQHANVDLKHGWFNYVFATVDLHRWHHSADFEQSNRNFGNNLIVWDWLFGTRYLPGGAPEHVGLGNVRLPENYWAHLASPLFLNRLLIEVQQELERSAEGASPALVPVSMAGMREEEPVPAK